MSHYPRAYSEDRTKGTNAIRQYLGNLKNAGSLYGRIIYNKAPIMMRQLESLLGEEVFQEGIQEYIKTYSNSNADWNELVSILDTKSSIDIKNWSNVWVNSSGRPIFTEEIELNEKGNISKFILHQTAEDRSNKVWPQSFKIKLIDKNGSLKYIDIKNMGKYFDISDATKGFKLDHILYNTNGFGYGVFPIYKQKVHDYSFLNDEVSRGYQFINLYENMLIGKIAPLATYEVYLEAIKKEENELITNYLSNSLQTIFWTFLTEKQKNKVQKNTENDMYALLEKDLPANIKRTLFTLYQSIAISEEGTENLYQIWKKNKKIKNLFLNENNFTSLAFTLAIFKHPKVSQIIEEQQLNISNLDRLERFKWLIPSVSRDENVRESFMKSLLINENREKESWVQAALINMHHPLRQEFSVKHLKSILEKLEEVQITGDIFFPKGWLASSIGNYSSKDAFNILQEFLEENPNYNPILIKKLLQTTDHLTRAQSIKN
jgi:aminopeptidase N